MLCREIRTVMNRDILVPCSVGEEDAVVWESLRIQRLAQSILESRSQIMTVFEVFFANGQDNVADEILPGKRSHHLEFQVRPWCYWAVFLRALNQSPSCLYLTHVGNLAHGEVQNYLLRYSLSQISSFK